MINRKPHARFILIAVCRGKISTGTRKVRATTSFVENVANVASQICLWLFLVEVSCEMWIPSASENASEIATVSIPAIIASFRDVAAFNPIMTPRVVMTPDVRPNAMPVLWESFIGY